MTNRNRLMQAGTTLIALLLLGSLAAALPAAAWDHDDGPRDGFYNNTSKRVTIFEEQLSEEGDLVRIRLGGFSTEQDYEDVAIELDCGLGTGHQGSFTLLGRETDARPNLPRLVDYEPLAQATCYDGMSHTVPIQEGLQAGGHPFTYETAFGAVHVEITGVPVS